MTSPDEVQCEVGSYSVTRRRLGFGCFFLLNFILVLLVIGFAIQLGLQRGQEKKYRSYSEGQCQILNCSYANQGKHAFISLLLRPLGYSTAFIYQNPLPLSQAIALCDHLQLVTCYYDSNNPAKYCSLQAKSVDSTMTIILLILSACGVIYVSIITGISWLCQSSENYDQQREKKTYTPI